MALTKVRNYPGMFLPMNACISKNKATISAALMFLMHVAVNAKVFKLTNFPQKTVYVLLLQTVRM